MTLAFSFSAGRWFGFKTAKLQNHKIDLGLPDGTSPIIFNHIAYCY